MNPLFLVDEMNSCQKSSHSSTHNLWQTHFYGSRVSKGSSDLLVDLFDEKRVFFTDKRVRRENLNL